MKDFFDEDFPLSKKQEEEYNKLAQTPMTLEEPPVLDEEPDNEPCFEPEEEIIPVSDEEDAIEDEVVTEEEETASEEATESYDAFDDEPIDEAFSYTPVEEEDAPETLAFDFFDEPLDEPEEEVIKEEPKEEKVPAVSHEEYLARLRQMSEIEEQLNREIKSLGEQLDSVEQKVDSLPDEPIFDEEEPEDFSYEYDERYFAEEETPAYKHPELYKKTAQAKPVSKKKKTNKDELTVNVKTLLKVGAAVAATVAAVKLLSDKDKK